MRYSSYQPSFIAVETVVVPIKYTVKTGGKFEKTILKNKKINAKVQCYIILV